MKEIFDLLNADSTRLFESSASRWKRVNRSIKLLNRHWGNNNDNDNNSHNDTPNTKNLHRKTLSSMGTNDFDEESDDEEIFIDEINTTTK